MESKFIEKEISLLERQLKQEKTIRFVVLAVLAVIFFAFMAKSNESIVVLVPAGTDDKAMTISENKASQAYLSEITHKVIYHAFNYSPDTVSDKLDGLLNFVRPEEYGAMKKLIEREKLKARKSNVSSVFYTKELQISEDTNQVVASGNLVTFSGAKIISNNQKSFLFNYDIRNHFLSLKGFSDATGNRKPFEKSETEGEVQ